MTVAAGLLPARRREWGRAMAVELTQIRRPGARWRFALGAMRVALLRPAPLLAGSAATGALALAAEAMPGTMTVFFLVCSGLWGGCIALAVARGADVARLAWSRKVVLGPVAGGVATMLTVITATVVSHPAGAHGQFHRGWVIWSAVAAVVVTGYLVTALLLPRAGTGADDRAAQWWSVAALAGCLIASAIPVLLLHRDASPPYIELTALTIVAAAAARSLSRHPGRRSTGVAIGAWAGMLAGLFFAAAIMFTSLHAHYTAATVAPYDVAAYRRRGFPDLASYEIYDNLGGIVVALVIVPVLGALAGLLGWSIADSRRRSH
jgi:hypothetical protein